jgi:hypothetical protein
VRLIGVCLLSSGVSDINRRTLGNKVPGSDIGQARRSEALSVNVAKQQLSAPTLTLWRCGVIYESK